MLKDQNLLKLASQMNNELSNYIDKNIFKESELNIQSIERRANTIEYLSSVLAVINEYSSRLTNLLTTAKTIQSQDFLDIEDKLNIEQPDHKKIKTLVTLVDDIKVPAICISSMKQLKRPGELYYIPQNNIFAIKICNHIYWGNVGNILAKKPIKIRECLKTESHSYENCKYYHPPNKFIGSHDIRNYMYNDWIHHSINTFSNRKVGSRDHLSADIKQINDNYIAIFDSQVMHDILCSLAIHTTTIKKL